MVVVRECRYPNCRANARESSEYCGPACERYFVREYAASDRKDFLVKQAGKRRRIIKSVLNGSWKTMTDLYAPIRERGYAATYRTLRVDLDALMELGVVERRMKKIRGHLVAYEYRNLNYPDSGEVDFLAA